MNINVYQLSKSQNILVKTKGKTFDEITRELPQGFYTTFSTLAQATKVLGLCMHLQRLYIPAKEQNIDPSIDGLALREVICKLAETNLPKESRVRLILAKNSGAVYILIQPFEALAIQIFDEGVKVVTAELTRRAPRVKDTGFIGASIEQRKLIHRDIFEVLLTKKRNILEGMTSNFYAIKGNALITAQRGILLGVTRRVILRLARGQGMFIKYNAPNTYEKLDEAFLTSSSRGIVPIVSIDNHTVGKGSVGKWTRILSKAYKNYVDEKSERLIE